MADELLLAPTGAGDALRRWMADNRVTVKSLSETTGLSERTITALRQGKVNGNLATWRIICRRTGLSMDEVMGL